MPVLRKLLVEPQTSGFASSRPSLVYLYRAFKMFVYVTGPCFTEKPRDSNNKGRVRV